MDVVESPQPSHGRRAKGWVVAAGAFALVVAGGGAAMALSRPGPMNSPAALSSTSGQAVADGAPGQQRTDGTPGQQRPRNPLGIDKVVTGTVVKFDGSNLVVDADGGSQISFTLSARLQTRLSATDASHPAAKPAKGDRVVVAASGTSPKLVAQVIRVIHPRVVGTVTKISTDKTTLTVVDPQGFTFTVDVSGVAKMPKVVAGDHIVAVGTVTGANTLKATKVTTNLRAAVRSEWPAWRGFHHHRPGTAPQQQSPSTGTTTSGFSAAA